MGRLFRSHAVARTVPAFLVGLQFVSVVTVYPDYLSYFNETIGDPQNGWRYLSDSNIDWGQDLPALAEFVEENEIDRISLAYFGAGSPAFYAIPFENIAVPNVFRYPGLRPSPTLSRLVCHQRQLAPRNIWSGTPRILPSL